VALDVRRRGAQVGGKVMVGEHKRPAYAGNDGPLVAAHLPAEQHAGHGPQTMDHITLGATATSAGLKLNRICLGTMTFGEQVGTEDAHRILSHALSRGVDFIDTCLLYTSDAADDM
jgi:hypothetical protein